MWFGPRTPPKVKLKAEARRFRVEQYLREWMPSIAYRGCARARRVVKRSL
jgi:hypothetical protein